MKQVGVLFILSFIFLISGCELEIEREFPRVWTLDAKRINNGVVLKGKILNLKDLDIDDYGFLWGLGEFTEESDPAVVSLMNNYSPEDLFEFEITNGIFSGRKYYFIAYAMSNSYLSLGTTNSFVSGDCDSPEIVSFYPQEAYAGDRLLIRCDNIIGPKENYTVRFDDRLSTVTSITNQTIEVVVPIGEEQEQSLISVSAFNKTSVFEEPFKYISPVIDSISPKLVYFGQEVRIMGKGLGSEDSWTKVFFNDTEAGVSYSSDSLIKARAPWPTDSLNYITVDVGLSASSSEAIGYIFPFTTKIIPSEARTDDIISVYGTAIGYIQPWNATIGGHWASIISISTDQIRLRVPEEDIGIDAEVKFYYHGGHVLICKDKFNKIY